MCVCVLALPIIFMDKNYRTNHLTSSNQMYLMLGPQGIKHVLVAVVVTRMLS